VKEGKCGVVEAWSNGGGEEWGNEGVEE